MGSGNGVFNRLGIEGSRDDKRWGGLKLGPRPWTATNSTTQNSDLNKVLGVNQPTYSNYDLTEAFFTSHTIDGITYSWSREDTIGWE